MKRRVTSSAYWRSAHSTRSASGNVVLSSRARCCGSSGSLPRALVMVPTGNHGCARRSPARWPRSTDAPSAMISRLFSSGLVAASLVLVLRSSPLTAQSASPATDVASAMLGFTTLGGAAERRLEDETAHRPSAGSARAHSGVLSAETHVAGTPAQARTRDYVLGQMRAMGLETEVRSYSVFLPHATSVRLWRIAPTEKELSLDEPAVAGDSSTTMAQYP